MRLAVLAGGACGRGAREVSLDLLVDFLVDISSFVIARHNGLKPIDLGGATNVACRAYVDRRRLDVPGLSALAVGQLDSSHNQQGYQIDTSQKQFPCPRSPRRNAKKGHGLLTMTS